MSMLLEVSDVGQIDPQNPFLHCELLPGQDPGETALEAPLFDFNSTEHQMGARIIVVPPGRAFARHTHPNAYHFIYVVDGTGIVEYDGKKYPLKPQQCCLVRKGVPHKLGAGPDGLRAIVVNTPTYDNGDPNHVHYLEEEELASHEAGEALTRLASVVEATSTPQSTSAKIDEMLRKAAPMGTAPMRYTPDSKVAWNLMWTNFCELALMGGPPHRSTLLEPVAPAEVVENPEAYEAVVAEIERGWRMVTGLETVRCQTPGWVGLACTDEAMALWMLRAIVIENMSVRREGHVLYLPAGPAFRLEQEIKNVITVVAKTYHYWTEHQTARVSAPLIKVASR